MGPAEQVKNHCLAVLIRGAGYPSLDRFAQVVNARAFAVRGLRLNYDHVSVKRWLKGGTCQYPDVVAAALSEAWGVPVPVGVIWPELRDGSGPVPAHLQAWVASRTLEGLGFFLRSDMLTRREMLADAIGMVSGGALTDPLSRWLPDGPAGIISDNDKGPGRIGLATVIGIEKATQHFAAGDATVGGGLSREAAVGQLKYAVDLATAGSYTEVIGNRLLAAIAELAGMVGWMSHDVGMDGPAQQYFLYGLQAARESTDQRAPLLVVGLLADLARQASATGDPRTATRLVDLAIHQLSPDKSRHNSARSMLWNLRARTLAGMGVGNLPEIRSAVALSFDLLGSIGNDDENELAYTSDAELAGVAACCFQDLAAEDRVHAGEAERHALYALEHRAPGFTRSQVFDQVLLARARFAQGEIDQAAADGMIALDTAASVADSERVTARLGELLTATEPYWDRSSVDDLRHRLRTVLAVA